MLQQLLYSFCSSTVTASSGRQFQSLTVRKKNEFFYSQLMMLEYDMPVMLLT